MRHTENDYGICVYYELNFSGEHRDDSLPLKRAYPNPALSRSNCLQMTGGVPHRGFEQREFLGLRGVIFAPYESVLRVLIGWVSLYCMR